MCGERGRGEIPYLSAQRFWFYGRCGLKMVRRKIYIFFFTVFGLKWDKDRSFLS